MPSLNGGTDEETYRLFLQHLMNESRFNTEAEALEYCVKYTLNHKYDADV